MNDQGIIRTAAAAAGLTQKDARGVVGRVLTGILDVMDEDGRIAVPHFGVFQTMNRKSRTGINPRTRQKIRIPASVSVGFKPSSDFKSDLNAPLKERQARERKLWEDRKEKEKYIPFDSKAVPVRKIEAPVRPVVRPPESTPEVRSVVEEIPASSPPHSFPEKSFETSAGAANLLVAETRRFQFRIILLVALVIPAVLLLGVFSGLLLFRSSAFDRKVQEKVRAYSRETEMSWIEAEKRIAEKLEEMHLDVSQTRDMFKRELSSLQDGQQRKIEERLALGIRKEMAARTGKRPAGKATIRIIRYRVRKGDNLWRISEARSGNPYNWVGIYETNGKKIKNPNLIYPGQEILIPVIIER